MELNPLVLDVFDGDGGNVESASKLLSSFSRLPFNNGAFCARVFRSPSLPFSILDASSMTSSISSESVSLLFAESSSSSSSESVVIGGSGGRGRSWSAARERAMFSEL